MPKIGIKNEGQGARQFHSKQTGNRLRLPIGLTEVELSLYEEFRDQIEGDPRLFVRRALNDVVSKTAVADKKDAKSPEGEPENAPNVENEQNEQKEEKSPDPPPERVRVRKPRGTE